MYPVEIRTLDALPVARMAHRGDYMDIGKPSPNGKACSTCAASYRPMRDFSPFISNFDDPETTPPHALRAEAAVFIGDIAPESPIERGRIGSGRYAVPRHRGPYSELPKAFAWFYRECLLTSSHRVADAPCTEECLNDWQTTPAQDLLTDIHIPLAG